MTDILQAGTETPKQNYFSGSGNVGWGTPTEIIAVARQVLGGIDCDPASNDQAQKIVQAGVYYTVQDDGLQQEWHGRVWLNPPYDGHLPGFVDKLLGEIEAKRTTAAIMLTNNCTDARWFHRLALAADALCFTRDRIWFIDPATGKQRRAARGQCFSYLGPDVELFRSVFEAKVGLVVVSPRCSYDDRRRIITNHQTTNQPQNHTKDY